MASPKFEDYQSLADSMNELLYARVTAAVPVDVLSSRGDKLVRIVESPDGEQFVTRHYSYKSALEIEGHYDLDFQTAWQRMHEAFEGSAIDLVPSRLIEVEGGEFPFVIVSQYIEDGKPLASASIDAKVTAIEGLGALLIGDGLSYIPSPEMVMEDMFLVTERDDETKVTLTDVDPRMVSPYRMWRSDRDVAFYINQLAELIWDKWGQDEERQLLASKLVMAIGDFTMDQFDIMSDTGEAFMNLHSMSNGLDNRKRWSKAEI